MQVSVSVVLNAGAKTEGAVFIVWLVGMERLKVIF